MDTNIKVAEVAVVAEEKKVFDKDLLKLSKKAKLIVSHTLTKGHRRIKIDLRWHKEEKIFILCDGFFETVEATKVTPWVASLIEGDYTVVRQKFEWVATEYKDEKGFKFEKTWLVKDYSKIFGSSRA